MKVPNLQPTVLFVVMMFSGVIMTSASTMSLYEVMKQVDATIDNKCSVLCNNFHPSCRCDDKCIYHKDCCKDAERKYSSKSDYIFEYMRCMPLIWTGTRFLGRGYRMVAECPFTWIGENIRQKCRNLEQNNAIENTPVSSVITNATYRNMFCAGCHGLEASEIIPWKFDIACKQFIHIEKGSLSSVIQSYLDSGQCYVEFKLPSNLNTQFERVCVEKKPNYIDKCPMEYRGPFSDPCDDHLSPVSVINASSHLVYMAYRNIDCMKCDDIQVTNISRYHLQMECGIQVINPSRTFGLYLTLNFHALFYGQSSLNAKTTKSCKDDEVLLSKSEQCVKLHCPRKSTPQNGNCVQYTPRSNKATLNLVYYVNASVDDQTVKQELVNIVKKAWCSWIVVFNVQGEVNLYHGFQSQSGDQCLYGQLNVKVNTVRSFFLSNEIKCMESHFKKQRVISNAKLLYRSGKNSTSCEIGHEPKELKRPFFTMPDYFAMDDAITCPSIQVYPHQGLNTTISITPGHKDGAVYYVGDEVIDADHVNVTDTGFYICWEVFKEYYDKVSLIHKNTKSDQLKAIVANVCMSLSIASLIVAVVHYIVVPKMLTNHTAVLLHLVVVMLLTHSTYILGVKSYHNKALCWWVGVFLHCMFLVLFFTMSLSLLQISLQLRNMKNPLNKKSLWHTIIKFILPGYIASLLITGTTLLLNHLLYPDNVWYGDGNCYITQTFVLLFSFAIPVALCVIFNISVFVRTVTFFCTMEFPNETLVTTNRNYFWLSVKLSTITGASWVIGFVAVFTRIEALEIAFEITSSLQGLFLSFSLISNQLVRSWYRTKYENMLQTFHPTSVEAA